MPRKFSAYIDHIEDRKLLYTTSPSDLAESGQYCGCRPLAGIGKMVIDRTFYVGKPGDSQTKNLIL